MRAQHCCIDEKTLASQTLVQHTPRNHPDALCHSSFMHSAPSFLHNFKSEQIHRLKLVLFPVVILKCITKKHQEILKKIIKTQTNTIKTVHG